MRKTYSPKAAEISRSWYIVAAAGVPLGRLASQVARVLIGKHKVGYEINFTRYFYEYKPLRSLEESRADILKLEEETSGAIKQILN